jgi:N-methylhydantoinase B/oxoprolinase/acetone carboxylase alpha subunit
VRMQAGDRLIIHTPGGGGYGPAAASETAAASKNSMVISTMHNAQPDAVDAAEVARVMDGNGASQLAAAQVVHPTGSVAEYSRLQESA